MILDKFLRKLGVASFVDLNEEERKTYKIWEQVLSGRRITDEDVEQFLKVELEDTLAKLPEQRLGSKDDQFLKMKLEFLRKVLYFLSLPEIEKKAAEAAIAREIDSLP